MHITVMPTVFSFHGIKIRVYLNDHNPPHCHIEGKGGKARYNLLTGTFIEISGFSRSDIELIHARINARRADIMAFWEAFMSKINFGKKNLLPGSIEPRDEKIRITIMLDGDVLDYFKDSAAKTGVPYQTQINKVLRAVVDKAPAEGATVQETIANLSSQLAVVDAKCNAILEIKRLSKKAVSSPRKSKSRS